ncbi:hypothetical protein ACH5RR_002696 [Cinchona calisaya]|uniref:Uncharacterized protein n=1 Tax=Cinchona calisaya TaxID=153742 RepID=A0ABD3ASQ0_9GENT
MARTKRQKIVGNVLIDENEHHEENHFDIDNHDSSDSVRDDEIEGKNVKKNRTRGPAYMIGTWGQQSNIPRRKVKFNENGFPIGKNKSQFVDFWCTIARNGTYASIDEND